MQSVGEPQLALELRSRLEPFKGAGAWQPVNWVYHVAPCRCAALVCDMWDRHWCEAASRRVDALAPRMNGALAALRRAGVRVVHSPSDTMAAYADTPQRARIRALPRIPPPTELQIDAPPLPIDDSDGGCDSGQSPYIAWTRQHPALAIAPDDVISDSGAEIYSFLSANGIDHLILMGVHTNMCVLGRSFGIRQMTRSGIRCMLVRDLTDAMYNPQRAPHVGHDRGTQLVVEHIEAHWCPTLVSETLIAAATSR